MSRFTQLATHAVPLGPCQCDGTPHQTDVAQVYDALGWDDLVDIGLADSEGAGRRILVTRAIASWNLVAFDDAGEAQPVPVVEATVRLLDPATLDALAEDVNAAYKRGREPVPNGSGAPSVGSSPESASPTPNPTPTPTTST